MALISFLRLVPGEETHGWVDSGTFREHGRGKVPEKFTPSIPVYTNRQIYIYINTHTNPISIYIYINKYVYIVFVHHTSYNYRYSKYQLLTFQKMSSRPC